jgi:5-methylcytosine-specific restriction enzyme A
MLNQRRFRGIIWNARISGLTIPETAVAELDRLWSDWVKAVDAGKDTISTEARAHGIIDPAFIPDAEGRKLITQHVSYERSARNRQRALEIHGTKCRVCCFDFDAFYGPSLSRGYIEIHHIKSITRVHGGVISPVKDLVPLCANCHTMAHREPGKIVSIKKLRAIVSANRKVKAVHA